MSTATRIPHNAEIQWFDRLDDFSLVMIFDWLNLIDLSHMAILNPRYHELIVRRVVPKLNEGQVDIWITKNECTTIAHECNKRIQRQVASGYNEALSILRAFGSIFTKLRIVVSFDGYAFMGEFSQSIALNCPQAIQEIKLYREPNENIHFSLPNVTSVILKYFDNVIYSNYMLDEMFPRMESLITDGANNLSFLGHHFEHLRHFHLDYSAEDDNGLELFMKLNPQLRSFKSQINWNQKYLKEVGGLLPNLEYLDVEFLLANSRIVPDSNDIIHFKRVKSFSLSLPNVNTDLTEGIRNTLTAIRFPTLESFKLNMNIANSKGFLLDLIAQNRDLNNVDIQNFAFTYDDLVRLATALPKLEQLTLTSLTYGEIFDLHKFLVVNRTLGKVFVCTESPGQHIFLANRHLFEGWNLKWENSATWEKHLSLDRIFA